jgi:hypothetical protein
MRIAIISVPIHAVSAVGAFDVTREQITGLPIGSHSSPAGKAVMDDGKYLVGDNRLMGSLNDSPLAFIGGSHFLGPVGYAFILALNQIADVDLVFQHGIYRCHRPDIPLYAAARVAGKAFTALHALIRRRRRDLQGVEPLHNAADRSAVSVPAEDHTDDFSGFWVNHQLMPVLRAFFVAVGGIVPPKFPPLTLHGKGAFDFTKKFMVNLDYLFRSSYMSV